LHLATKPTKATTNIKIKISVKAKIFGIFISNLIPPSSSSSSFVSSVAVALLVEAISSSFSSSSSPRNEFLWLGTIALSLEVSLLSEGYLLF